MIAPAKRLVVVLAPAVVLAAATALVLLESPAAGVALLVVAALAFLVVQQRRGTRATMMRLSGMDRRHRLAVEEVRAEARRAAERHRSDQHQILGQLTAVEGQISDLLARLVRRAEADRSPAMPAAHTTSSPATHPPTGTWATRPTTTSSPATPSATTVSAAAHPTPPPSRMPELVPGEETFCTIEKSAPDPAVVLVLQTLDPDQLFAGIATAVSTSLKVARRLGRNLRIVAMTPMPASSPAIARSVERWVAENAAGLEGERIEVVAVDEVAGTAFHAEDVWVATYWTTAHALATAVRADALKASQVLYLVQDFEPGFYAWGTSYALAAGSYHHDFAMIVNSRPLADHLVAQHGVEIDPAHVFRPEIDVERLRAAAERWTPGAAGEVRVLLYGRPSKPRNMFSMAVAAMETWVGSLPDGVVPVVRSAGEEHDPVRIGPDCVIEPLGKLTLPAYYDTLARTDLGLALMHSPHPGHLALELPVSGIPTVTNLFAGARRPWVDGLELADPTPGALAFALESARRRSEGLTAHTHTTPQLDLGRTLDEVLDSVLSGMSC